ncbi:hypothetical protein CRE_09692 [Caenorhabditis remanei]|uniref:Uncharacterized protein n=1 Tax=Caenorhabditis remanei TaxID=31234 RepID=E3MX19_CAERE|nr:hypothetical protein CRE_09692 [Caenorhabditis remanei]
MYSKDKEDKGESYGKPLEQTIRRNSSNSGIPLTNSPPASPNGDSEVPEAVQFEEVEAENGQEEDPAPRASSPRASSPRESTPRASSPLTSSSQAPPDRLQSHVEAVVDKTTYKMRRLERNPMKTTVTDGGQKDNRNEEEPMFPMPARRQIGTPMQGETMPLYWTPQCSVPMSNQQVDRQPQTPTGGQNG